MVYYVAVVTETIPWSWHHQDSVREDDGLVVLWHRVSSGFFLVSVVLWLVWYNSRVGIPPFCNVSMEASWWHPPWELMVSKSVTPVIYQPIPLNRLVSLLLSSWTGPTRTFPLSFTVLIELSSTRSNDVARFFHTCLDTPNTCTGFCYQDRENEYMEIWSLCHTSLFSFPKSTCSEKEVFYFYSL